MAVKRPMVAVVPGDAVVGRAELAVRVARPTIRQLLRPTQRHSNRCRLPITAAVVRGRPQQFAMSAKEVEFA